MGDVENRGMRFGEVRRADFAEAGAQVPIQCKGIAALAMYVNTVAGMKWRCNRCGAEVPVVSDAAAWFAERKPTITADEARVFMALASHMRADAVH